MRVPDVVPRLSHALRRSGALLPATQVVVSITPPPRRRFSTAKPRPREPLAPSHKNGTPILDDPGIQMSEIREIAATPPTPMTLQQMKIFADGTNKTRIVAANFLHKELQIRFARAIVELSELPLGLANTESIQRAIRVYCDSIHRIQSTRPPTNATEDLAFTEAIRQSKQNGANLVPLICGGLKELAATDLGYNTLKFDGVQEDLMHRLDTYFLARIGIRMLIGQHVDSMVQVGGRVELVNVEETVRSACDRAANLCRIYCGAAPEVEIKIASNLSAPFTYVESHLHHMIFELVKNAMRATVVLHNELQNHGKPRPVHKFEPVMDPNSNLLGFVMPDFNSIDGTTIYPDIHKYGRSGELPPVEVVVCQGHEDLTIKVSDNGGGVKRSDWHKLWHYGYTTSPEFPPKESYGYHSFRQHFSGGGYGLPMARLFARYFGGEVTFTSLEGYGSSVFIQAHRLGRKTEMVPGHASFSLQPLYS